MRKPTNGRQEPAAATTGPPGATAEPPGATTGPPGATTEPPGATTGPPGATADPRPRTRRGADPFPPRGFLGRLLSLQDPDRTIRRLRRRMLALCALLAAGVLAISGSLPKALGALAAALLVALDVQLLIAASDRLLEREKPPSGGLRTALLAGRHVLLALGLCAIVLVPGVGPIPVALGLSVPVLAILLEAILELSGGEPHQS